MTAQQEAQTYSSSSAALPSPHEKHDFVRGMFDALAPRYDLLNSLLSARLHHGWRRRAADLAEVKPGDQVLDVCTGTGDFAFELARRVGRSGEVTATDFSLPMLARAEEKRARGGCALRNVRFVPADTQDLPFDDAQFDAVTVGFGIRNVAEVARGIAEMARVVREGGRVVVLEFNQPTNRLWARLYGWYSFHILPRVGGLISGRRAAYAYLPASVAAFYTRAEITRMMTFAGLGEITVTNLLLGSVVIHRGVKNAPKGTV